MRLSDHDLLQLTDEELLALPEEVLRRLSVKLLNDLKEAREQLKQSSRNSSRPPSSDSPWDRLAQDEPEDPEVNERPTDDEKPAENKAPTPVKQDADRASDTIPDETQRKPGKQPGAAGYGRTQKLAITAEEHHFPRVCARCESSLNEDAAKAYTAFETLDVIWADPDQPGIRLDRKSVV